MERRKKSRDIFGLIILGTIAVFILFTVIFHHSHFILGTYIQGVDCSCLTVEKARTYINAELEKEIVVVRVGSDNIYVTTLGDFGAKVDEDSLRTILQNQKLRDITKNIEYMGMMSFDTEAIKQYLRNLIEKEENTEPQDAYIEWNDESHEFQIVQEQYGESIDFEESYRLFIEQLEKGEYDIALSKSEIVAPGIIASMLEPRLEAMNSIIKGVQISNLDTRVELDITEQRVLMYVDGECILDTPCVTGNVAGGCGTPTGVYHLYYKTRNAVLRGSNSDGSKYASPVDYWMPFNGGIGFHDASWRNGVFGGEIYRTDGSHGCVNMPHEAAKTLYKNISTAIPIIIYES